MKSRKGLLVGIVVVLALVGVGVYFATRTPEAKDDAIVDLAYDELLPKLVLASRPCGLQGRVTGMLLAKTTERGVELSGWKNATDAGALEPSQRECLEQQIAAAQPATSKTLRIPPGREYEIDVSFTGLGAAPENY